MSDASEPETTSPAPTPKAPKSTSSKWWFALVLIGVAVLVPYFFPNQTSLAIFKTQLYAKQLELKYIRKVSEDKQSLASLAFAEIFRASKQTEFQPWEIFRKTFDGFGFINPMPSDAIVEAVNISRTGLPPVRGYWIDTPRVAGTVLEERVPILLYLHGGGFTVGSLRSHGGFAYELARRLKGRAFFLDYRLAPEMLMPGQVEEALAVYRWLIQSQNVDPKNIAIVGDSAGGGLTLLTTLVISEKNMPLPGALATFSAWTDLVVNGPTVRPSYKENSEKDIISPELYLRLAVAATGTKSEEYEKRMSPRVSPIYASLEGKRFPPLLMQVGGSEVIRDDTIHFVGKAQQIGLDVTLQVSDHMQHITSFWYTLFPEAEQALSNAVEFLRTKLSL